MDVALNLRDFVDDPIRPVQQQIEEAAEITRRARSLGFMGIYAAQHWISYPTVWLQPLPLLARLAGESGDLKLITGVILLPLHNPVYLAEQVITVDHITGGRLILGVGLGYRRVELEAVGSDRNQRTGRFEECLALMKLLWSGQEVSFEGRYWTVHRARVGVPPVQKPHPPVWIAAQSELAARRAATMGDGCLLGPQQSWEDLRRLASVYHETVHVHGAGSPGLLGANRSVAVARDRETAIREAREVAEGKAGMYGGWDMQERTTVDLGLGGTRELTDWAAVGSPEECAEAIARCYHEDGVRYTGLGFLNLPKTHAARLEYLQYVSEELLPRLPGG